MASSKAYFALSNSAISSNFTLGLNIVLVIAVAVLFYLHFSTCKKCTPTANTSAVQKSNTGFKIAYFEMDSLQSNFDYYKLVAKELGNSEQQKRNDLASKKDAYVAKVKEYQSKGQSMSQADMAKAQQDIAQREREYQITQRTGALHQKDTHPVKRRNRCGVPIV